jgi:hypothetical protein
MRNAKKLFILLLFLISTNTFAQVKYEVITQYLIIEKSREILISQIGIVERTNHNDGPEVKKYLNSVGLNEGNPWCNAIQYWVYKDACDFYYLDYSYIPMYKNGLANSTFSYGQKFGKRVAFIAKVNDFIIWKYRQNYKGHIGRIIKVGSGGWVYTVEGNTSVKNTGSQRDGDGVGNKKRNIYHPLERMNVRGLIGVVSDGTSVDINYKCDIK